MRTIRDILNDLNIPFRETGQDSLVTRGWVGIKCPMPGCGQGGKFGRGIHVQTLKTSCWKCGSARLGDVLCAASGRPMRDVLILLSGIAPDYATIAQDAKSPIGRYEPPPGVGKLLPAHRRYLERRGFDPDQVHEQWGVQGIGAEKWLPWRLYIPVRDNLGRDQSWTTRAVGSKVTQRYMSAPPTRESKPLKSLIFGEHLARHAVVITEGCFGAMRIGPGGVATLGLTFTRAQVSRLSRFPVRVCCFDNEPAAQRRARALAAELEIFPGETFVVCLSGPDPDTSPLGEIEELRSRFLE